MIRIIREWLRHRIERKRKEEEAAFRYMVRQLIQNESPTLIIERATK